MRIVCPNCSATYEVPDRLAGTGKRMRCARCAHEWAPPAAAATTAPALAPPQAAPPLAPQPGPPPAAASVAPPLPQPASHPASQPTPQSAPEAEQRPDPQAPPALHAAPKPKVSRPGPRSAGLRVALALGISALLLAALLAAGVIWRTELMRVWPASRLLFDALRLG